MELIDKFAVVAEIKRRISLFQKEKNVEEASQTDVISLGARAAVLEEILSFLDTLEVKEVDLEKELDRYTNSAEYVYNETRDSYFLVAKYFFELGLKAQKEE